MGQGYTQAFDCKKDGLGHVLSLCTHPTPQQVVQYGNESKQAQERSRHLEAEVVRLEGAARAAAERAAAAETLAAQRAEQIMDLQKELGQLRERYVGVRRELWVEHGREWLR